MLRPLRAPRRDQLPAEEHVAYDRIVARQRTPGRSSPEEDGHPQLPPYHAGLATSPPIGELLSELGRVVRQRGEHPGTYSHADREFVDQILSKDVGWNGLLRLHVPDGIAAGVRPEAIEAIRGGREQDLNPTEQLLALYIRQMVSGTVKDETWEDMVAYMGVRGTVDYSFFIMFLLLIIRTYQAFGGPGDVPDEEIDALVQGLKSGQIPIPDFRSRLN